VVAVVITLLGAALLRREVLKPIQMLWINLIMDTLASIALTTEDPHPDLLLRTPHARDDYIISSTMLKHIIGQSIFQITIMLIFIFMGETFIPEYADSNDIKQPYLSHPEFKWRDGVVGGNICSGRFYFLNGDKDYFTAFEETKIYSRHFTMVFNVFVMMQIFNFINDRKLREEVLSILFS
jgi:Ca2+ transporting ATPase